MPKHQGPGVIFLPEGMSIEIGKKTSTVLSLAIANDLPLNHSCGGMGTCGTCRIYVESNLSDLPPRNEIELEMAQERSFTENERLACQLPAHPGLVVRIPDPEDKR